MGAGVEPDITIPNPPSLPNLTVLSAFADITGVPEILLAANITSSNPSSTENSVPTEPSTLNKPEPEPSTSNDLDTNDPVAVNLADNVSPLAPDVLLLERISTIPFWDLFDSTTKSFPGKCNTSLLPSAESKNLIPSPPPADDPAKLNIIVSGYSYT